MISDWTSNEVLDIFLHVIVWYLALVLFFYSNAKKMKTGSNMGYANLAKGGVHQLLDSIQTNPSLNTVPYFTKLQALGNKINSEASSDTDNTDKTNRSLMITHISVIGVAILAWLGLAYYFHTQGLQINFKRVVVENMVTLVVMFGIESSFLTKQVPKYKPFMTPSYQFNSALDRIKMNIKKSS